MSEFQPMSLFRSHITARRFDDGTLAILETLLISKDVRSSMDVRSSLTQFMRIESLCTLRQIAHRTVEQKLSVLEFFVKAFALIGDFEARILYPSSCLIYISTEPGLSDRYMMSCLALRYEELWLREFKSASHHWLQVDHMEWITFAEHSLDHGFYSIAGKACTNALASLQKNDAKDVKSNGSFCAEEVIQRIQKLKDIALKSTGSFSVQVGAEEYLKKKTISKSKQSTATCDKKLVSSSLFRDSIKKRNARKLHKRQSLKDTTGSRTCTEF